MASTLPDAPTMPAPPAPVEAYPPPQARTRAVLVRNITHAATGDAIDDFFSFCGAIESKRVRTVAPVRGAAHPTLEAVVVFADDAARNTALMMNDSIIVDQPVKIVAVPSGYDFNASVRPGVSNGQGVEGGGVVGGGGGLFGEIGSLFSTFSSTVSQECKKAAKMLDEATDSGVLRQAKDGARDLQKRTLEIASEIDDRYHVKNTLLNAAEAGKSTASALIEQTRAVATHVDEQYHISETTSQLADKALENDAVKSAQRSLNTLFNAGSPDAPTSNGVDARVASPPVASNGTPQDTPANGAPTS